MTADSQPCVKQVEGRYRGGDGDSRAVLIHDSEEKYQILYCVLSPLVIVVLQQMCVIVRRRLVQLLVYDLVKMCWTNLNKI